MSHRVLSWTKDVTKYLLNKFYEQVGEHYNRLIIIVVWSNSDNVVALTICDFKGVEVKVYWLNLNCVANDFRTIIDVVISVGDGVNIVVQNGISVILLLIMVKSLYAVVVDEESIFTDVTVMDIYY